VISKISQYKKREIASKTGIFDGYVFLMKPILGSNTIPTFPFNQSVT